MKPSKLFALLTLSALACLFSPGNTGAADIPTVTRITSPVPVSNGNFGRDVAVSGNRMIVSSNVFDSKTYIYDLDTGAILHTITQNFISKVALDGDFAVLSNGSSQVFVYKLSTEELTPLTTTTTTNTNDSYGSQIAIHGNRVLVGDPSQDNGMIDKAGAFYVFDTVGNELLYVQGTNERENLGGSVALDASTGLIGAPGKQGVDVGKVVILDIPSLMVQPMQLVGDDTEAGHLFGDSSVSISEGKAIVGVSSIDAAYVFDLSTGNQLRKIDTPVSAGVFGGKVSLAGNTAAISDPRDGPGSINRGAVFLYDITDGSLQETIRAFDEADQDFFGEAIALTSRFLVVGVRFKETQVSGSDHGAVYVYDYQPPSNRPGLKIKGRKTVRTSRSRLTIRGTATDEDDDLKSVQVKDTRPRGSKKFRKAKGTTKWRYKAPLRPGRNRIKAFATDDDGNRSRISKITVLRR